MEDLNLGERVRELRALRHMSTRQLAELAGISAGYVSQIENGQANVSLDVLRKIADAFGVQWTDFFSATPKLGRILRKEDRPTLSLGSAVRHYGITQAPIGAVEVFLSEYEPGSGEGNESYTHGDSQEICIIITGTFKFTLGGESYQLNAGDSLEYRTSTPHSIVNIGADEGQAIWVVTPPTQQSLRTQERYSH